MAKLSTYPNANNASGITLFGLQSGADVQVPPNALARAIQDAIAVAVPFNFAGAITASNLSGTNTGDQPPLGYVGVLRPANATMAAAFENNRLTAAGVAMTTPASPADFDQFIVTIEDASFTGCSLVANGAPSGVTIEGLSTFNLTIVPCAFCFCYNLAAKNWFALYYRLGSLT